MAWFNQDYHFHTQQAFRFAHFTDCHLFADKSGEYFGVNTFDYCQQTLAAMAVHEFDCVVFGGDLTQDHTSESYQTFAKLVAGSDLECPVFWVPGNHDDIDELNSISGGQINSAKHLIHPYAHVWLVNSKGPTPAGWVEPNHLHELRQEASKEAGHHIAICHHHPVPINGYLDKHILENGELLLTTLSGIEHCDTLIHGHTHNEYEQISHGIQVLGTPATSVTFTKHTPQWQQQDLGPAFRVFHIDSDGELTTRVQWLTK